MWMVCRIEGGGINNWGGGFTVARHGDLVMVRKMVHLGSSVSSGGWVNENKRIRRGNPFE